MIELLLQVFREKKIYTITLLMLAYAITSFRFDVFYTFGHRKLLEIHLSLNCFFNNVGDTTHFLKTDFLHLICNNNWEKIIIYYTPIINSTFDTLLQFWLPAQPFKLKTETKTKNNKSWIAQLTKLLIIWFQFLNQLNLVCKQT